MLNELYSMQRGLEKIGVLPPVKHNDIKSPGMGTTFRVRLDLDGCVERVEWIDKDKIKDTWSLRNGNKNQFPAIKLAFPLIPEAHGKYKQWKENNKKPKENAYRGFIHERIKEFGILLEDITEWPGYRNKILERKEQFSNNYKDENFYQIFDRYSKSGNNGTNIVRQVYALIRAGLDNFDLKELSAVSDVLFGTELDNKGVVKDGKRVTLLLDVIPSNDIDHYASSRREVLALSKALFEIESQNAGNESTCALTGKKCHVVDVAFPEEKLSIVGGTKLYAKNSETSGPTVERYNKSGAGSYHLSDELSKKLAASISLISSEKYKGKTWSKIPSSTGRAPSLLLAYCKDDLSLTLPRLITGEAGIEDFEDYQDATKTVLDLFDRSNCTPDAIVEIAEIIVLDKVNRKINYSTTSSIGRIRQAADEWLSACENVPDFKIRALVGKESKRLCPWPIAPSSLVDLSRNRFKTKGNDIEVLMLNRNGRKVKPNPSIVFSDSMKIFFSFKQSNEQLASRSLAKISNQFEPLISHCALSKTNSVLGDKSARVKMNPKNNTQALNAVTVMSALLYKLGRKSEVYMNEFAYQLGQLCSAVDELHIGYCKSMRGGDIPNTLIGNLTYGMALQSPTKALAVLATRIKPYETWAKKSFDRKAWIVKKDGKVTEDKDGKPLEDKAIKAGVYANRWLSGQSKKIHSHFADNTPLITDTYKTELMLGYLAGRPCESEIKQTNTNDTQGEM
ncbi:MAG: hypothetical protein HY080_15900 [Gammaproteobacteria bacterium]|nr:hypothetical protein [Gammaproteobacteria bacterium]